MDQLQQYMFLLKLCGEPDLTASWQVGFYFNRMRCSGNMSELLEHARNNLISEDVVAKIYKDWCSSNNIQVGNMLLDHQQQQATSKYINIEKNKLKGIVSIPTLKQCNKVQWTKKSANDQLLTDGDIIGGAVNRLSDTEKNQCTLTGWRKYLTSDDEDTKKERAGLVWQQVIDNYIFENMKTCVSNIHERYKTEKGRVYSILHSDVIKDQWKKQVGDGTMPDDNQRRLISRAIKMGVSTTKTRIGDYSEIPMLLSAEGCTLVPNADQCELLQSTYYLDRMAKKLLTNPYRHFILRSPTGTGKTIAYTMSALAQIASDMEAAEVQPIYETTRAIVYTNNQTISTQVALDISTKTTALVSQFQFYCDHNQSNNTIVIKASIQQYKNGCPLSEWHVINATDKNGNPIVINERKNTEIILYEAVYKDSEPFDKISGSEIDLHTITKQATKYYNCNTIKTGDRVYNMQGMRKTGAFGTFLVAPFMYSKLLYVFGLIDIDSDVSAVIFDEVDVFYNDLNLNNFHKLYMKNRTNLTAKTVVFASATIDKDLINCRDINLSTMLKHHQMILQRTAQTHIKMTDTTDADINKKLHIYTLHTVFAVLKSQFYDPSGSNTVEKFIQATFNKLWNLNAKYLYFIDDTGNFGLNYIKIISSKQIKIKWGGESKIYDQNDQMPSDMLDLFKDDIDYTPPKMNKHALFATDIKLLYARFLQEAPQSVCRDIYIVNNLASYKPNIYISIIKTNQADFISKLQGAMKQKDDNNLVLYFNDLLIVKLLAAYNIHQVNIASELQVNTEPPRDPTLGIKLRQLMRKVIVGNPASDNFAKNLTGPFQDIFIQNMTIAPKNSPSFAKNSALNIRQIGRGVDIKGLNRVILLLPATIPWNDLGFNFSEFVQSVGRVGRGGDIGQAVVLLYGVPDAAMPTDNDELLHYAAATGISITPANWSSSLKILESNIEGNDKLLDTWIKNSGYPLYSDTEVGKMATEIDNACMNLAKDYADNDNASPLQPIQQFKIQFDAAKTMEPLNAPGSLIFGDVYKYLLLNSGAPLGHLLDLSVLRYIHDATQDPPKDLTVKRAVDSFINGASLATIQWRKQKTQRIAIYNIHKIIVACFEKYLMNLMNVYGATNASADLQLASMINYDYNEADKLASLIFDHNGKSTQDFLRDNKGELAKCASDIYNQIHCRQQSKNDIAKFIKIQTMMSPVNVIKAKHMRLIDCDLDNYTAMTVFHKDLSQHFVKI